MRQIRIRKTILFNAMVLIAAAAFFSGCATMNKDECLTADWQSIGFEDGSKGQPASRIGEHRKACAKHGVQPDMEAYTRGRDDGLKEFCRPANGYQYGLNGNMYHGVCPKDLAGPFESAYNHGHEIFTVGKKVKSTTNEIERAKKELEQTKKSLSTKEAQIVHANLSSTARQNLMDETKELAKTQGTLEGKITSLEKELALLQNKYAELQQQSW